MNYCQLAAEDFSPDPQESIAETLFAQYERVVIQSLITSFGLDFLIQDRHGGDVDTIHNVRRIGEDDQMTYKNKAHEEAYEKRGTYNSEEYHKHSGYIEKNREVSQQRKDGTLRDTYTGEKIAPNGKSDLDHVISAKEIHEDRGRVLAGLNGADLANSPDNLKPTNPHTNRTKKADSMDTFLDKYGEEYSESQKGAILNSSMTEEEKHTALQIVLQDKNRKANILITGATGCGKSSTINALFRMEKAKVGDGFDPETMTIQRFELGNLILWDSPGFGDGAEADERCAQGIIDKLNERDEKGDLLIDVVLVLLDGSIRDLGTSYELINKIIIPHLQDNRRLLIGVNKADMAMRGRNWDGQTSKPQQKLQEFLDEKAASVQRRIQEATGVIVEPVCYSAGFKEEGQEQEKPYNLAKLLCYMIERLPAEKRMQVADQIFQDSTLWQSDDGQSNYQERIQKFAGQRIMDSRNIINIEGGWGVYLLMPIAWVIGTFLATIYRIFCFLAERQKNKRARGRTDRKEQNL